MGRHSCGERDELEGSLLAERREYVQIAARRWMMNKKELEMEVNVSQHPRVY